MVLFLLCNIPFKAYLFIYSVTYEFKGQLFIWMWYRPINDKKNKIRRHVFIISAKNKKFCMCITLMVESSFTIFILQYINFIIFFFNYDVLFSLGWRCIMWRQFLIFLKLESLNSKIIIISMLLSSKLYAWQIGQKANIYFFQYWVCRKDLLIRLLNQQQKYISCIHIFTKWQKIIFVWKPA